MNIRLTFDIEVWCGGWQRLDEVFPSAFERYVYGRSAAGEFALPRTLEILAQHGLQATFFVEPLFALRFGAHYLKIIVDLIRGAGQEVQLHLHPEWTDEIRPPLIERCGVKRQHLTYYDASEQAALVARGKAMLQDAGAGAVEAFRAGSFAVNRDTLAALRQNGITVDSSVNCCYSISGADLADLRERTSPFELDGVVELPVSVFVDGFGRWRPAQVGACSSAEFEQALQGAARLGTTEFVLVSHNFEMLRPGSSLPDRIVERRFDRLCRVLAQHRSSWPCVGLGAIKPLPSAPLGRPRVSALATARRHAEQALRRLVG